MRSVVKTLQRELRGRFGRLPVWPPGSPIALGDVGRFDTNGWVKVTTLDDLGIPSIADVPGEATDIDLTSERGVSLNHQTAVDAIAGTGRLSAKFTASGSFVLKANAVVSTRLTQLDQLEQQFQALLTWEKSWSVVTEVSAGGPSCVLVAGESGAEAELILAAGPAVAVGLSTRMSFATRHGMAAAWITENPAPVMMRAHYLRSSFIGGSHLSDRGEPEPASVPDAGGSRLAEVYDPEDVPSSA